MNSPREFKAADIRALVVPLFIELALGMAVGLAGTLMAAQLSDTSGAAFALSNHLFSLLFMVFRLVGAGTSVVVTQNLGAKNTVEADRVARSALACGTWLGGLVAALALVGGPTFLQMLNAPPDVLPVASALLLSLAPALLLDAWNASMSAVMRAHLRNRETLVVMWIMHLVHLGLAWPLMMGWGEIQSMGLPGFAIALIVSRLVGLALHGWFWSHKLRISPRAEDWWILRRAQWQPVLQIGLPGAAENLAWELAFIVSVAAVGVMGTTALATQAYVLQFNMWILVSGAAIGITIEMIVGHMVGAAQFRQAHTLVKRAQAIGFSITLAVACLMAWHGPALLNRFSQDPEIIQTGTYLLWMSILLETGRTFNLIVIGALRATGDARYPFQVGVISMGIVLAGGSWVLGVYLSWGLLGVWLAYSLDEWLRGLLMWRRWVTQGWVPQARAARRRVKTSAKNLDRA